MSRIGVVSLARMEFQAATDAQASSNAPSFKLEAHDPTSSELPNRSIVVLLRSDWLKSICRAPTWRKRAPA